MKDIFHTTIIQNSPICSPFSITQRQTWPFSRHIHILINSAILRYYEVQLHLGQNLPHLISCNLKLCRCRPSFYLTCAWTPAEERTRNVLFALLVPSHPALSKGWFSLMWHFVGVLWWPSSFRSLCYTLPGCLWFPFRTTVPHVGLHSDSQVLLLVVHFSQIWGWVHPRTDHIWPPVVMGTLFHVKNQEYVTWQILGA